MKKVVKGESKMAESIHSGHRKRVRKEFLLMGLNEATPPHKIIEYILFHSIPQKDTNEIAHELLERYGSISAILDAPVESLMKVKGISEVSVSLLKLILPVARIYQNEKSSNIKVLNTIDEMSQYIIGKYFGYNNEVFSMLSMNASGKVLGFDIISSGNVSEVSVSLRDVVETALKRKAACTIIAHNHPGGVALPSGDDIKVTEMIYNTLKQVNVILLDHVIIADDDYVSMLQSTCFNYLFRGESAPPPKKDEDGDSPAPEQPEQSDQPESDEPPAQSVQSELPE